MPAFAILADMEHATETLIIGAGQAGLAMSRCLTDLGRDHLILEKGRVAERWRSERWDSLTLLTPNWQTRLPGYRYRGDDPDGFMSRDEVVSFFEGYATSFSPPVVGGVEVSSVAESDRGFEVTTDRGRFDARNVVVATGHAGAPSIPTLSRSIDPSIHQLHSAHYRNPRSLPEGGVLVVGAAASGQQIASELLAAGRRVVLSVGRHTKLPRRYRGRDIFWWLDASGKLHESADTVPDLEAARRAPSFALTGRNDGEDLDLHLMACDGMTLAGRLLGADGSTVGFADDVDDTIAEADQKMSRVLRNIDRHIDATGTPASPPWPRRQPLPIGPTPTQLDLQSEGISTIVWATGYRRDLGFLDAPILDAFGEPIHERGLTTVPGLAFVGLRWQSRRNSNFIDGVGDDAAYLAERLAGSRLALTA